MTATAAASVGGALPAVSLWDTHCHLADARFADDRADVLGRARVAGVVAIVVVGASPEAWSPVAALAAGTAADVALPLAAGLHPHEARQASRTAWRALEEVLAAPAAVALGEIGLDYHYDLSPRDAQRHAFAHQLEMAARLGLPVILHERQAAADLLDVLRAVGVPPAGGVWHCFSGDADLARQALDLGFHLGFGGLATFPKGTDAVRAAARLCPRERLLLETDAPYLSPAPYRGRRNEPARVADVLAFLAALRAEPPAVLAAATTANAAALFRGRAQ